MANFTEITTSAGTIVVKSGEGVLEGILVSSPGTTWKIQIFDSADVTTPTNGGGRAIFGATAVTVPAAGTSIPFGIAGVNFSQGLIVVMTGTAGELTVFWR